MPTRDSSSTLGSLGMFVLLLALLWSAVMHGTLTLIIGLAFLVVLFFSYHLELGLYILIVLYPLIGWEFHIDKFKNLLGSSFASIDFYAPMVDLWAVFLLGVYAVYLFRKWITGEKHRIYLPQFWFYVLFVLSAVLSLINVSGIDVQASVSYMIRFIVFVYIGYVVLGSNIIRDKIILRRSLAVSVWVSVVGAVLGLVSLVLGGSHGGVYRAVPIPMFGWSPFNYDAVSGHILLAEVLVVAFPIAIYLMYTAKKDFEKICYAIASAICGTTAVLTFSRASWLTLVIEVLLAIYLFHPFISWKKIKGYVLAGLVFFIPAGAYMLWFLQSAIVSSSNTTRIVLTEIAWSFFLEHPIIGVGVGTFVGRLTDVYYFTYEFGDPIDAHSILTKILSEQGLLGVCAFALFVGSLVFAMYARTKNQKYDAEARATAYLCIFLMIVPVFFQLFNTQYYSARMWVPFMLAIAAHLVYRHDHTEASFYTFFRPDKYQIDTEIT